MIKTDKFGTTVILGQSEIEVTSSNASSPYSGRKGAGIQIKNMDEDCFWNGKNHIMMNKLQALELIEILKEVTKPRYEEVSDKVIDIKNGIENGDFHVSGDVLVSPTSIRFNHSKDKGNE